MSSFTHLRDLIDLAQEPSSDRRRELLRNVTDLFLENPADYTPMEREHFSEILGGVARTMATEVREELARRLASIAEAPRDLVIQLAHDEEVCVATPILETSTVLSQEDLLEIVERCGNGHRAVVATRADIDERLSEALVDHGDDQVVSALISNNQACIAPATIEKVAVRATSSEILQAPLIGRDDLPADVMHEMYWAVSGKLRTCILERSAELDPEIVDKVLVQMERKLLKDNRVHEKKRSQAQEFIDRKAATRELSETLLVDLVRTDKLEELACGFAHLVKIDAATARRILHDPGGEALAIACKATRFDKSTFSTLALLAQPDKKRGLNATRELLDLYEQIPQDVALRTMRFWRVRSQGTKMAA